MNDRQIELIMQIIREQLDDYFAQELAEDLARGIKEGIWDNLETLNALAIELEDQHE